MSFVFPDLVIESILRDGLKNIEADPSILNDVFGDFSAPYANRKYGLAEIQRIQDILTGSEKTNIAIVHSFHEAAAKSPCISIQLGSDIEGREVYLDDFSEDLQEDITDEDDLAALVKVPSVLPDSYDATSGKLELPDSVDLSDVYTSFIYVDGSDVEFVIQGGISEVTGDKFIFIPVGSTPDIGSAGSIKSFLSFTKTEVRSSHHDVQILLGVHTKEPLFTKYLYTLTKYFLKSRKESLIKRGFVASTMSGSDFNKDQNYVGDQVFTRFLTVSGKVEDAWRSDQVQLFDHVEIDAIPEDC